MASNPDFAERGLGQEPQTLGNFRVSKVEDGGNEEERKKSYTATRTECYPPPPNPPKFSRGLSCLVRDCNQTMGLHPYASASPPPVRGGGGGK